MDENGNQSNKKAILQGWYNMDSLLSVYSSMDEDQQETERKQQQMIVSSVNYLYNDCSIFNNFPLPIGVMIQPFEFDSLQTLRIDQEPVRCEYCDAIASSISEFELNGCWKCAFCNTKSSNPYKNERIRVKTEAQDEEQFRELSRHANTVEYSNGVGDLNEEYAARADIKALIFVIDKSLSSTHFKNIQKALSIILENPALSNYYIGLIVFGEVIEIYEMGGNVGEADVFSATQLPTEFDEHYIRKHEREGSDRHLDGNASYNSYLVPITTPNHLVELVGTFAKKNEEIHPISIGTFLTATKYAELLFSTGFFSSGQIVVCSYGFFYDLVSDPYFNITQEWLDEEILQQQIFNHQTRLVIDLYLTGCMYNSIKTLKSLISANGGMILLLSDAFQADFLNCLNRSFYFLTTSTTIQIYVGEGLEVDRVLGTYLSSTIKKVHHATVVTVEVGRVFVSTSITLLLSSTVTKQSSLHSIPIQAEVSYREVFTDRLITRRCVVELEETDDASQFLGSVDGSTTAVIIAKDLCSNLETSKQVTESVKYGIDCLLSQILNYYKIYYHEPQPITLTEVVPALSPTPTPPPPTTPTTPLKASPSPIPLIPPSASYSSFYSYTRTLSQTELSSVDRVDSLSSHSPYYHPVSLDVEDTSVTPEPPVLQSGWSHLLSFILHPSFSLFSSFLSRSPSSVLHSRSSSSTNFNQSKLPPSLRNLPLFLYYLRRGCLFGDCFHNGDLLQLHRLLIASASLKDSIRLILPRLIVARDKKQEAILTHSSHSSVASPPPLTHVKRGSGDLIRYHRRGNSHLTSVASLPVLNHPYGSVSHDITSEVVEEEEMLLQHLQEVIRKEESDCKEIKKYRNTNTEIKKREEEKVDDYIAFVAEDDEIGNEYYLESRWLQNSPSANQPEFTILSPETVALLSDSVVVLDTEREILIWIGHDRMNMKNDDVFNHCLSLALSLTQERNPPSVIRVVTEYSSNSRFVLCNLIPSHKDPMDITIKSLPILKNYSISFLKEHYTKFLYTDDMSFREYMTMIYHFR